MMVIQMLLNMLELNKEYIGKGKLFPFISSRDFNALMHGFMLLIIWSRLLSILIPTKLYGTLLKMLAEIFSQIIPYFFILLSLFFGFSLVFTAFFDKYTLLMASFSYSFRTLFSAAYNNYNMEQFQNTQVRYLGEILFGAYIFFMYVLMKNFLIAILSYVYEDLLEKVESQYRSTLIIYHNKWEWDDEYGILILLPSPMSLIVFSILPLLLTARHRRKLNLVCSKCLFILFVLPQFALFACLSALYILGAYLGSIISFAKNGNKQKTIKNIIQKHLDEDESDEQQIEQEQVLQYKAFSYQRAAFWLILGSFIVTAAYFRDLLDFWRIVYRKGKNMENQGIKRTVFTEKFCRMLQKYLKRIKSEEKALIDFSEEFHKIDLKHMNAILMQNQSYILHRKRTINDFLGMFVNSRKNLFINVPLMKVLLKKQSSYSAQYIKRAKFVCIPWIVKAIMHYRTLIGGIEYQGMLVPKSLITEENSQIKKIKSYGLKAAAKCQQIERMGKRILYRMKTVSLNIQRAQISKESIEEFYQMSRQAFSDIKLFNQ